MSSGPSASEASAPRLKLTLLGGFEARLGPEPSVRLRTKKAAALLAYLALPPGRAHPRDHLATLLWGESPDEEARASLRNALTRLRHELPEGGRAAVVTDASTVALDSALVEVDAVEFERAVTAGTLEGLEQAAALYRGDLLAGTSVDETAFEEWLAFQRDRLRELAVDALARLLAHQKREGQAERAVQTALRLLALDPLQEAVHRMLIQL